MVSALRSKVVACVLVLFTFVGSTGVWHAAADDPDCAAPSAHNHSAHNERITRSTNTQAPSHCAICHWLQSFRTDAVPSTAGAFGETHAGPPPALARRPHELLVRVDLPSRAPPTLA